MRKQLSSLESVVKLSLENIYIPIKAKIESTNNVRIIASLSRLTDSSKADTITLKLGMAVTDLRALKTLNVLRPVMLPRYAPGKNIA